MLTIVVRSSVQVLHMLYLEVLSEVQLFYCLCMADACFRQVGPESFIRSMLCPTCATKLSDQMLPKFSKAFGSSWHVVRSGRYTEDMVARYALRAESMVIYKA